MIIYLSEEHKKHLQIIKDISVAVLIDFCKLSWDFLQNGPNIDKYKIASYKLQVETTDIQNAIHALTFIIVEGCKYNLSENDFKMTLSIAGFTSEHQDILLKFYNSRKDGMSEYLCKLQELKQTYQDLDWRFEVEIASMTSEEIKPKVTMDLILQTPKPVFDDPEEKLVSEERSTLLVHNSIDNAKTASECENIVKHVLLECDLPNLLNMTSKLEQALHESKSQHVKKIQRALQRK